MDIANAVRRGLHSLASLTTQKPPQKPQRYNRVQPWQAEIAADRAKAPSTLMDKVGAGIRELGSGLGAVSRAAGLVATEDAFRGKIPENYETNARTPVPVNYSAPPPEALAYLGGIAMDAAFDIGKTMTQAAAPYAKSAAPYLAAPRMGASNLDLAAHWAPPKQESPWGPRGQELYDAHVVGAEQAIQAETERRKLKEQVRDYPDALPNESNLSYYSRKLGIPLVSEAFNDSVPTLYENATKAGRSPLTGLAMEILNPINGLDFMAISAAAKGVAKGAPVVLKGGVKAAGAVAQGVKKVDQAGYDFIQRFVPQGLQESAEALLRNTDVIPSGKPMPMSAEPLQLFHGTHPENVEKILAEGFRTDVPRVYGYSELGPDTVYLAPKNSWWYDPAETNSGRTARYKSFIPVELDEQAKLIEINSPEDWESLARRMGYTYSRDDAVKMLGEDLVQGGDPRNVYNERGEAFSLDADWDLPDTIDRSRSLIGKLREEGYDGIRVGPTDYGLVGTMPASNQVAIWNPSKLRPRKPNGEAAWDKPARTPESVVGNVVSTETPDLALPKPTDYAKTMEPPAPPQVQQPRQYGTIEMAANPVGTSLRMLKESIEKVATTYAEPALQKAVKKLDYVINEMPLNVRKDTEWKMKGMSIEPEAHPQVRRAVHSAIRAVRRNLSTTKGVTPEIAEIYDAVTENLTAYARAVDEEVVPLLQGTPKGAAKKALGDIEQPLTSRQAWTVDHAEKWAAKRDWAVRQIAQLEESKQSPSLFRETPAGNASSQTQGLLPLDSSQGLDLSLANALSKVETKEDLLEAIKDYHSKGGPLAMTAYGRADALADPAEVTAKGLAKSDIGPTTGDPTITNDVKAQEILRELIDFAPSNADLNSIQGVHEGIKQGFRMANNLVMRDVDGLMAEKLKLADDVWQKWTMEEKKLAHELIGVGVENPAKMNEKVLPYMPGRAFSRTENAPGLAGANDLSLRTNVAEDVAQLQERIQKVKPFVDRAVKDLREAGITAKDGELIDDILPWAAYEKHQGSYSPNLYRWHEADVKGERALKVLEMHKRNGTYIPPEVEEYIKAKYVGGVSGGGAPDFWERTLQRTDIDSAYRNIIGAIEDPAVYMAEALVHTRKMTEMFKLRRHILTNSGMASAPGETMEAFAKRMGINVEDVLTPSTDTTNAKFWGPLAAVDPETNTPRYVHPELADFMTVFSSTMGHRDLVNGAARTAYENWKWAHVPMSLGTQVRQVFQNLTQAAIEIGPRATFRNLVGENGAIRDYFDKTGDYLEARKHALFSAPHLRDIQERTGDLLGDFKDVAMKTAMESWANANGGLLGIMSVWGAIGNAANKLAGKAEAGYAAVDDLARLTVYKELVKAGHSPANAVKIIKKNDLIYSGAKDTRFNRVLQGKGLSGTLYAKALEKGDNVPLIGMPKGKAAASAVDLTGKFVGNPFIGVTQWSLRKAYEGLAGVRTGHMAPFTDVNKALRSWTLLMLPTAISSAVAGLDETTPEQSKAVLQPWQKTGLPIPGTNTVIGSTTMQVPQALTRLLYGDGKMAHIDIGYLMPWNSLFSSAYDKEAGALRNNFVSSLRGIKDLPRDPVGVIPWAPIVKPLIEIMLDRDLFMGADNKIIGATTDSLQGSYSAVHRALAHLYRSYMPPIAPGHPALAIMGAFDERRAADGMVEALAKAWVEDSGTQMSPVLAASLNNFKKAVTSSLNTTGNIGDYKARERFFIESMLNLFGFKPYAASLKERPAQRGREVGSKMETMRISKEWAAEKKRAESLGDKARLRDVQVATKKAKEEAKPEPLTPGPEYRGAWDIERRVVKGAKDWVKKGLRELRYGKDPTA